MGALPATKTPICDIPHLVGIPAPEHLRYQAVIVASIVPRVHALEAIPVVGKDLFEEVPGRRSCCSHQAASLQSVGWWVIALFYHIPSMTSTPSAVLTRVLPPPRSPLHHGDVRAIAKWKILCYRATGQSAWLAPLPGGPRHSHADSAPCRAEPGATRVAAADAHDLTKHAAPPDLCGRLSLGASQD